MTDYEQLKIKHNEVELHFKLARGDFTKENATLKELFAEAEQQRDAMSEKLKNSDTANMEASLRIEEEFRRREAELER